MEPSLEVAEGVVSMLQLYKPIKTSHFKILQQKAVANFRFARNPFKFSKSAFESYLQIQQILIFHLKSKEDSGVLIRTF